ILVATADQFNGGLQLRSAKVLVNVYLDGFPVHEIDGYGACGTRRCPKRRGDGCPTRSSLTIFVKGRDIDFELVAQLDMRLRKVILGQYRVKLLRDGSRPGAVKASPVTGLR